MWRTFETNEFYHIFNRGIEKRPIYLDNNDFVRFIHDVFEFNDENPAPEFIRRFNPKNVENSTSSVGYQVSNIRRERRPIINLHAFSLMKNHHHLLAEQIQKGGMSLFGRKLYLGYTNGFNAKHQRSGHLFQGTFKAVHVSNDIQLRHLVCYIHANPLDIWKPKWKVAGLTKSEIKEAIVFLSNFRWSSHLDYLGYKNFPSLLNFTVRDDIFGGPNEYKRFFLEWLDQYANNFGLIEKLIIEKIDDYD